MRMVASSEWWRLPAYVLYAVSFSLFPWIIERIPLSVAYATWSGAGCAAVSLLSVVIFHEKMSYAQWIASGMIIASIFILHFT